MKKIIDLNEYRKKKYNSDEIEVVSLSLDDFLDPTNEILYGEDGNSMDFEYFMNLIDSMGEELTEEEKKILNEEELHYAMEFLNTFKEKITNFVLIAEVDGMNNYFSSEDNEWIDSVFND